MSLPLPAQLHSRMLLGVAICSFSLSLRASLVYDFQFNSGLANGGLVPDGDLNGWQDTRNLDSLPTGLEISTLTLTLSLSGGYNGDLYAYLGHAGGVAVLLNRVGRTAAEPFGYGDAGMNVTLADTAPANIHLYGGNQGLPLTGTWQPDGRTTSPLTVLDTDPALSSFRLLEDVDPRGDWTLFVADLSGGEQTTVDNWTLHLATRPAGTPDAGSTAGLLLTALASLALFRRHLPHSQ